MAAGYLPTPGKVVQSMEIGPCIEDCKHPDCAMTRKMAATICHYCDKPIGYEIRFYQEVDDEGVKAFVHADCLEDFVELDKQVRFKNPI